MGACISATLSEAVTNILTKAVSYGVIGREAMLQICASPKSDISDIPHETVPVSCNRTLLEAHDNQSVPILTDKLLPCLTRLLQLQCDETEAIRCLRLGYSLQQEEPAGCLRRLCSCIVSLDLDTNVFEPIDLVFP